MSVSNENIIRELVKKSINNIDTKLVSVKNNVSSVYTMTVLTDSVSRSINATTPYTDTGALWNITGLTAGTTYTFTSILTVTSNGLGVAGVRIRNSTDDNAIIASHNYSSDPLAPTAAEVGNTFVDTFSYTPAVDNFNLRMQMYATVATLTKSSWKLIIQV